jgi:hypothetical protein
MLYPFVFKLCFLTQEDRNATGMGFYMTILSLKSIAEEIYIDTIVL